MIEALQKAQNITFFYDTNAVPPPFCHRYILKFYPDAGQPRVGLFY